MKFVLITIGLFYFDLQARAQDSKKIQKAWIKINVENLSPESVEPDTSYTRYTFDEKGKVNISFSPGWDDLTQDWSMTGNNLTFAFSTYRIESLTDSTLVYKIEGFRRMSLVAEDYLNKQEKYLDSIGMYRGKPLYRANKIITPRYKKKQSLPSVLSQTGYEIKRASEFLVSFIVTEEGKIENIQIKKSIIEGYDAKVIKLLKSTSKDWVPAKYNSKSVQTEMLYRVKYLNSIVH
ncbi:hypothetical protein WSM22_32820 [Cytophagales bacterium WSM2-2]|nr:hypothetical protein WSM22_32820 [Cytophagales bacterium WSM2-2]